MTLILRSVLFNLLFYLNLVLHLVATVPALLMSKRAMVSIAKSWGWSSNWLLRVICNVRTEFVGLDKISNGPLLVASKHQSIWETFSLMMLFDMPTFVLKRELMWLPFFGWGLWKAGMIPVDRGAGSRALAAMTQRAAVEVRSGRQLIIFPEGTRRPPGAEPKYKFGVAHLYEQIGVPCVPIALNSGLFWGRRQFIRRPGTIRLEVLDPIAPGLDKQIFFQELQARLENATDRLIAEGRRELEGNGVAAPPPSSSRGLA
ncbi:MAG: lysophospholipid acyltransferase family protein [Pseudorhodoplanes sp.]